MSGYKKAEVIWKKEKGFILIIAESMLALNKKASFIFENIEKNFDELLNEYYREFYANRKEKKEIKEVENEIKEFIEELENRKLVKKNEL